MSYTEPTVVHDRDAVRTFVFPDDILIDPLRCASRAILVPNKKRAEEYNKLILERLPEKGLERFAADTIKEIDDEHFDEIAQNFLDGVIGCPPPGVPPHCILFKVGAIYRLMKTMSSSRGLVKNTIVVVKQIMNHIVVVRKLHDTAPSAPRGQNRRSLDEEEVGDEALLLRMIFEAQLAPGYTLRRRAFPLEPAYATSLTSYQGLTLDRVAVDLSFGVSSREEFDNAMLRIRNINNAVVRLPPGHSITTSTNWPGL